MSGKADTQFPPLEERLGYAFKDESLLTQALTHRSALSEGDLANSYERLEFLGDRVLGLAVSEMLLQAFEKEEEGVLARRFNALVRRETCAAVARDLGLGVDVIVGPSEEQSGGRRKTTILSDVCEAVIGAVFLDGGYEAARALVAANWRKRMMAVDSPRRDAKTALQEWSQGEGMPAPTYEQVARDGPDHAPTFTVRAMISGLEPAQGKGRTKRDAEQAAAENLLVNLGLWSGEAAGHG